MTAAATTAPPLRVKVYPFREGLAYGNIVWAERDQGSAYYRVSRFAMRAGVFPPDHPVGGKVYSDDRSQGGEGESIRRFRALGYWASCFPEGDGVAWMPLNGQGDEQCLADIRAAFGWDADWGVKP